MSRTASSNRSTTCTGALKFWVVVHPHNSERLERRLCKALHRSKADSSRDSAGGGGGDDNAVLPPRTCSQFVCHLSAWVTVGVLDRWDILYPPVGQRAGELVVTAPSACHQG
jgi:hypothetical protein